MEYSSANLIAFFYKNRKPLLGIPFLAMVVAVVFSGPKFIKPLFESQVILFPSTTNSVSKALLPQSNGYGDEDIFEYYDKEKLDLNTNEQILEFMHSKIDEKCEDLVAYHYELYKGVYISSSCEIMEACHRAGDATRPPSE